MVISELAKTWAKFYFSSSEGRANALCAMEIISLSVALIFCLTNIRNIIVKQSDDETSRLPSQPNQCLQRGSFPYLLHTPMGTIASQPYIIAITNDIYFIIIALSLFTIVTPEDIIALWLLIVVFIFERVPGLGLQLKDSLSPPSIPTTLEYQKRISWRRRKICLQLHFPTAGNRFHTAVLWYMPRQPHRISHIHHHCQQQHRHNLYSWSWPVFSPWPGLDRGAKRSAFLPKS